jgi:hypothetical protein
MCYIVNKYSKKLVGLGAVFLVSADIVLEHALMANSGQNRSSLWHQRYGHLNLHYLSFMVVGLPNTLNSDANCTSSTLPNIVHF